MRQIPWFFLDPWLEIYIALCEPTDILRLLSQPDIWTPLCLAVQLQRLNVLFFYCRLSAPLEVATIKPLGLDKQQCSQ